LVEPSKAAALREDIKKSALERQALIDIKRVAELLSVSTGTVWALISTEDIPQPLHIGRSTRWRENEILAWIEEGCPTRERWELTRKAAVRDYEVARRKR
jgi:predicted DNA-binding transcriptional regulator AlpA